MKATAKQIQYLKKLTKNMYEPKKKNFNVWAYAMVLDEASVVKAIDTAFYINRKYKGAIIKYGFTSLSERQLQIELNK